MLEVIRLVVDEGSWLEVHAGFAKNIVVGFARLGGNVVGGVTPSGRVVVGGGTTVYGVVGATPASPPPPSSPPPPTPSGGVVSWSGGSPV